MWKISIAVAASLISVQANALTVQELRHAVNNSVVQAAFKDTALNGVDNDCSSDRMMGSYCLNLSSPRAEQMSADVYAITSNTMSDRALVLDPVSRPSVNTKKANFRLVVLQHAANSPELEAVLGSRDFDAINANCVSNRMAGSYCLNVVIQHEAKLSPGGGYQSGDETFTVQGSTLSNRVVVSK
jgi:hypothetical protein